ncbi:MAG: hypothetical protein DLM67_06615 [Candidatus Nephthysia bennettiae]|nr:MAG: hypothetical protein DLM67_06615 [Candidatus Dormibacteraeota bacterium]
MTVPAPQPILRHGRLPCLAILRDELFNREIFHSVIEARVLYFDWCDVYNNFRPHSSIGYLAPTMFATLLLGKLPARELEAR